MDKNSINQFIGLGLIFVLLFIWVKINEPTEAERAIIQAKQDSLNQVQMIQDSLARLPEAEADPVEAALQAQPTVASVDDSTKQALLTQQYGAFGTSLVGEEQQYVLENDLIKLTFSSKGGRIVEAFLKQYEKSYTDEAGDDARGVLKLLEDEKNRFEYILPLSNGQGGEIKTSQLYFTASKSEQTITFKAAAGNGFFEQSYTLNPDSYHLDYNIRFKGLNQVLNNSEGSITLNWQNYLGKLERNDYYERNYSSVYWKTTEDSPDYCSCTSSETEEANDNPIKWVSHSNQFFNSTLIANETFKSAVLETEILDENASNLKKLGTQIQIPFSGGADETVAMQFYIGPNEYKRLAAFDNELQDIIPYGRSIFGTINRWIIRPLFNLLSSFIGNKGLVILALTILVKLALYPLTYKMLYSQSKMGALKPQLTAVKEKFGEDQQKQQMETMKLYREFGVSPLGGCLPIALQMPIWFALYRFFPASIEFRQASFLWATDLSSYDVFFKLPFELPLGMGAHVSLFTLLWAVTTLIYTFYNTRHMDMSMSNPMMKYMQYVMPIMFMGFFNSFAAGLTCYLFFSNTFNIAQTIVTKNYLIDQEKIKKELEEYRKKPKKKGGFQQRLENALKEQQKMQAQKEKDKKKKK
jgi:YidC/Oxa1 family membrane protein insertase